jgi:hypothetical protein
VQLVRWAATATALEPRSGGRPLMLGVDGIWGENLRKMGKHGETWWIGMGHFPQQTVKQPEGYIRQS